MRTESAHEKILTTFVPGASQTRLTFRAIFRLDRFSAAISRTTCVLHHRNEKKASANRNSSKSEYRTVGGFDRPSQTSKGLPVFEIFYRREDSKTKLTERMPAAEQGQRRRLEPPMLGEQRT
jgi:hypothetical protein